MKEDTTVEHLIDEALRRRPWMGACSLEEAIEGVKTYRRQLDPADRRLFDQQIQQGQYPLFAVESVEIAAGRQQPQGTEEAPTPDVEAVA